MPTPERGLPPGVAGRVTPEASWSTAELADQYLATRAGPGRPGVRAGLLADLLLARAEGRVLVRRGKAIVPARGKPGVRVLDLVDLDLAEDERAGEEALRAALEATRRDSADGLRRLAGFVSVATGFQGIPEPTALAIAREVDRIGFDGSIGELIELVEAIRDRDRGGPARGVRPRASEVLEPRD